MSDTPLPQRDDLPLSGVRVIDLTTTIAGPSATRLLADFGAQVIKVESTTHPDTARLSSPYAGGVQSLNSSGYFSAYNAGKLSMVLNLRTDAGVELLGRLVEAADVLVESFAPGVMGRLGLDDARLRQWNANLIIAHHSLQGQVGPRSRQRGYGQLASAMTGWFRLTGLPDEDPVGPYSAFTDFIAWPFLTASVILALEARDQGGEPATIDHSHVESSAYFAAPELLATQRGVPPRRCGNEETYASPSEAFRCAGDDDWCAITVETDDQWRALCDVLGMPELAADARFATAAARIADRDGVAREVAARTIHHAAGWLDRVLSERGVPASHVSNAEDLFADPQLASRRTLRRVGHAVLGEHAVVAPAFQVSGVESGPDRGFPLLGEHTDRICRDVLRLDDDEIARYAAAGAFE